MESKRLESRKTLRSGADKLAGTMISNFKNTLELTQRRELEGAETTLNRNRSLSNLTCVNSNSIVGIKLYSHFKADLRNVSQSTFIDAEFYEEYIAGEDWVGEPYIRDRLAAWVSFYFNKEYVLRRDEGMFSRYECMFPNVSFDNPWKPQETKSFEVVMSIYDDDAVTKGFTAFDVKSCILHFNLTVEDPDGRKIPMKMKFDLADVWKDFIDK